MRFHHRPLRVLALLRGLLFLGVVVPHGFAMRSRVDLDSISTAACTDSKLSTGTKVDKYVVQTCLGKGVSGELWTLQGSGHVLKYYYNGPDEHECLFGKIAAQKDPAHFVNCFDVGHWNDAGYSTWDRVNGEELFPLLKQDPRGTSQDLQNQFPNLRSVIDHLSQLFHMFDALQKPGTIAPGIGVRQWHHDSHAGNLLVSPHEFKLIDYGVTRQCCAAGFECGGLIPGPADWTRILIKLVESNSLLENFVKELHKLAGGKSVGEILSLRQRDPHHIMKRALSRLEQPLRDQVLNQWPKITSLLNERCSQLEDKAQPHEMNFHWGTEKLVMFFASLALPLQSIGTWYRKIAGDADVESLVAQFQSSLRSIYQEQWNSQCDDMVHAIVQEMRETNHVWPPPFMNEVDIALNSL